MEFNSVFKGLMQVAVLLLLLLLQGPEHMLQMHCSLYAYCATLTSTPPWFRRSYFSRQVPPRPYNTRDPRGKRWNCGRECWPI